MKNNVFTIAYKYHTLGRCVIPSGGGRGGKQALIQWKRYQNERPTGAQLDEWQKSLNPPIWAMPTGPVSGLFVVDCDNKEANAIMETTGLKPHTQTRKGFHYYVAWPSWAISNSSRILPGVDIRGQGGYVNFCGENGKASYKVLIMPTDDSLYTVEQLPAKLQKALKPKPKTLSDHILQDALYRAQPGNRNETGLWLACQLRDNSLSQTEAKGMMLRYVAQVGDTGPEPYTESEALSSLEQAFTRPAREPWHAPDPTQATGVFNLTDLGNAERLIHHYGNSLRYCYERKRWLVWTGRLWEWDSGAKITTLAQLTVRNIYHEAANEPDEKERKEIAVHARRSEGDHRINAMINQALNKLPVKATELDTNPWLLNCLNGTIDLKTGQLLPHRKEDLLTVVVPVEYYPEAQCPRWLSFLDQVTGGDTELAGFLQRAIGYSLTGDTKSQVVFLLYGLGNNGKSTFTMTIRRLLAGYAERLDADDLMVKDRKLGGGPKEGIANLRNKRYVVGSELQDGKRLDVSLIKDLTGGETVKARRLYEHDVEFMPTFKLWLYGNHKPVIADSTLSIWRRMKQIPFNVTIPDSEIDQDLPSKLKEELPGILAWAVKGCLDWQQYGLKEPEAVTNATASYRHEQDILADFIEDYCILEPLATIPKSNLKDGYQKWCQDNSVEPVTQRTFRARLVEKGIIDHKGTGGQRCWKGIRLKIEQDLVANSGKTNGNASVSGVKWQGLPESPLIKEKQKDFIANSGSVATNATDDDIPDYPTHPCRCGCGDYWLADDNRWLCSQCHTKPEEDNGQ